MAQIKYYSNVQSRQTMSVVQGISNKHNIS